jgi:hypothetical protein
MPSARAAPEQLPTGHPAAAGHLPSTVSEGGPAIQHRHGEELLGQRLSGALPTTAGSLVLGTGHLTDGRRAVRVLAFTVR